jgi:hypothetical protein
MKIKKNNLAGFKSLLRTVAKNNVSCLDLETAWHRAVGGHYRVSPLIALPLYRPRKMRYSYSPNIAFPTLPPGGFKTAACARIAWACG